MLKNTQYVIIAYSFAGAVLIAYALTLFFRLRRVGKKLTEIEVEK